MLASINGTSQCPRQKGLPGQGRGCPCPERGLPRPRHKGLPGPRQVEPGRFSALGGSVRGAWGISRGSRLFNARAASLRFSQGCGFFLPAFALRCHSERAQRVEESLLMRSRLHPRQQCTLPRRLSLYVVIPSAERDLHLWVWVPHVRPERANKRGRPRPRHKGLPGRRPVEPGRSDSLGDHLVEPGGSVGEFAISFLRLLGGRGFSPDIQIAPSYPSPALSLPHPRELATANAHRTSRHLITHCGINPVVILIPCPKTWNHSHAPVSV